MSQVCSNPARKKVRGFIKCSTKENTPFQLVEADLKGPLPKARNGYNNILVLMDPTTKFVEMLPVTDQQSASVCKMLKDWISRYGILMRLHTDNGPCFVSEMIEFMQ